MCLELINVTFTNPQRPKYHCHNGEKLRLTVLYMSDHTASVREPRFGSMPPPSQLILISLHCFM